MRELKVVTIRNSKNIRSIETHNDTINDIKTFIFKRIKTKYNYLRLSI